MNTVRKSFLNNLTYQQVSSIPLKSHIIFWISYFLLNVIKWGNFYQDQFEQSYFYSFKSNLLEFSFHIILSYLFIYIYLPKLFKGETFKFFMLVITSLFLTVLFKFELTYYLLSKDVLPEIAEVISSLTFNYVISTLLGEIYVITFVTSIKLVIDWIKQREIIVKTNKILLENELKYLRSQIQPHFFFNTLNNLYSLTIDKSDKAPNLILKLSDLMKYFLYETGKEFQKLEKEINHIKDYIEIEKLRYDESLSISFDIKGEIKKKKIRPLLLIPLVENAFKHGARSSKLNGYINIDLKVEGDFLNFRVENSMTKINNKLKEQIGGIGLSNIKKRLELNYGEGNFDLKNFEEKNKYIAQLRVKLKT